MIVKPSQIKVVTPPEPVAPDLASQLPRSLRLDVGLAEYYREACDAYSVQDQPDEDVLAEYGLPKTTACNWAADCYTLQDGLTIEYIQVQQADYAERLRSWGRQLEQIIRDIEESTNAKTN